MKTMKPGQTGYFFAPSLSPFELGRFCPAIILEVRGDKLLVEIEDGTKGEILASDFTLRYFVGSPHGTAA
jgi:hypothetical protein